MSTPRILFVDHTGALGGAELYLYDVARNTPGAQVVLFEDGPFRKKLESAEVPVTVLPASPAILSVQRGSNLGMLVRAIPSLLTLVFQLARLARSADVVFLNSQKALVAGALAARLARRPAIWNLHDILTADHFSDFNRRLAVFCANHLVARVVVNSEATRSAFLESGGRTPTELVYNGIDSAPYDAVTNDQVASLRREFGLGDSPIVGVFSRLAPWKGQHVLIEALTQMPNVHALLVGEALFREDANYEKELRAQSKALGVSDRIHFLGFRDDIPALMKLVDIVVHTSIAPEPFGRVVVEGMLALRPVLATQAGGVPEIIDDGNTGRLVPCGDAHVLSTQLLEMLENPSSTSQMAAAGYTKAKSTFSQKNMVKGLHHIFYKINSLKIQ